MNLTKAQIKAEREAQERKMALYDEMALTIRDGLRSRFPFALLWYVPTWGALYSPSDEREDRVIYPQWNPDDARAAGKALLPTPELDKALGLTPMNIPRFRELRFVVDRILEKPDYYRQAIEDDLIVVVCYVVINGKAARHKMHITMDMAADMEDPVMYIAESMADAFGRFLLLCDVPSQKDGHDTG